MAKKIIAVFCALTVLLCGCGRKVGENFTESDRFVVVSGDNCNAPYHETVIADKEAGVLYIVVYTGHQFGISPLIDKDGTPLLWEESDEHGSD